MFRPGVTSTATDGSLFVVEHQSLCVVRDGRSARAPRGPAAGAMFLGEHDGVACFARTVAAGGVPADSELVPLRALFGVLSDDEFAIAGRALGLTAWDHDHRYCGRCGATTERSAAERVRTCSACAFAAYPRLSPAIITLVERDGRALLARNARYALPFFTTLAGFVEVGETLEETVAREVREEVGVEVTDVRYFGSQPWPFTGSLMIGFTARWARGELVPDPS